MYYHFNTSYFLIGAPVNQSFMFDNFKMLESAAHLRNTEAMFEIIQTEEIMDKVFGSGWQNRKGGDNIHLTVWKDYWKQLEFAEEEDSGVQDPQVSYYCFLNGIVY